MVAICRPVEPPGLHSAGVEKALRVCETSHEDTHNNIRYRMFREIGSSRAKVNPGVSPIGGGERVALRMPLAGDAQ